MPNSLKDLLDERFGGVISVGSHEEDGVCCVLELLSVYRGIEWTDQPSQTRCFDIRPLNDHVQWTDDGMRTTYMLSLVQQLDGSLDWPFAKKKDFCWRVMNFLVDSGIYKTGLSGLMYCLRYESWDTFVSNSYGCVYYREQLIHMCQTLEAQARYCNGQTY